jgi:uncharacterized membrane protein
MFNRMENPDALVHQCRNLARMPEGPDKESMKQIAEEMLQEREARGEITAELRAMLLRILRTPST